MPVRGEQKTAEGKTVVAEKILDSVLQYRVSSSANAVIPENGS